jgi:outer membrane protein
MKNGLLIWNVLLTILTGFLLFAYLYKKDGKVASKGVATPDTSGASSSFRIAYFEMDSVENNFDFVKDVKAEIEKKEEEYTGHLSNLDMTYRKKVQEYQQKEKSGTMNQADYDKAMMDLRQLEESLKNRKQSIDQEYQDFVARRNLAIKKEIEDFLTKYNQTKNYSYIVAYEQGLFYYRDSAYNITSDLIKGLNEEYKDKKKK